MKYSFFALLFCLNLLNGQEKKTKPILTFSPELNLFVLAPIQFGNNFLAEAHKSNIGFGTNLNVVKIYNFKLGMGYDYISYSITDVSKVGNVGSSRYNSFYGLVAYPLKVATDVSVEPYIGLGSVNLNFKSGSRSFGHQTGSDFRIGINVDYKLDKTISAIGGFGYVSSSYDVKTAPEFVSFYDNSKMLLINIGIKLDFKN